VLWSSAKLEPKALVRGARRQIDQFGQKSAAEGNFKISIIADPGEAQIQKSDIFKIKHENVIMDVTRMRLTSPEYRVDSLLREHTT
jgi:flagellin